MRFLDNVVKQKLGKGERVTGSWINLPCLETTEILCRARPDFLVVDAEHTVISPDLAQRMAMVMEGYGVMPYIRVAANDPTLIKQALDAGFYGIIVPMVNSAAEARAAVEALYYKPRGIRGAGLSRAQGYGTAFAEYWRWAQEHLSLIVQIEDVAAVGCLRDILAVKGIDATMIGPYDASASLGFPGEFTRPEVRKLVEDYESISEECGVPTGFHIVQPDRALAQEKLGRGYAFLAYGIDELFLANTAAAELSALAECANLTGTNHQRKGVCS